ncbi:MAG: hypothetical protein K6G64_00170 [Eubacterium sp.]|nr:hypothetical protein [Eubacterium sp.]
MRKEDFLKIVDQIDDDLIEEATEVSQKKSFREKKIFSYVSVAASIVLVAGGSFFGGMTYEKFNQENATTVRVAQETSNVKPRETIDGNIWGQTGKREGGSLDLEQGYQGSGSGKFVYDDKTYHIVNNAEFLVSNSMPIQIEKEDIGKNLANNVLDTSNNQIGNIYMLNFSPDYSMIAIQNRDGSYNIALEEDE